MTDATRDHRRPDGNLDLFEAIENGQRLHRQAINASMRRLLARLQGKMPGPSRESTISTVDEHA
ncbi:MAG: hypothetical protein KDJ86_13855 [Bauldia sp.]|uniref:hypothetical protein n=1 Tax=Bauldia sp. TaxID=2575872 RepID=UPI001E03306A|nr:hypothetical protein [Bauldia sp.]MCB1496868.1 hypothetical protein [Bauldia sp.]